MEFAEIVLAETVPAPQNRPEKKQLHEHPLHTGTSLLPAPISYSPFPGGSSRKNGASAGVESQSRTGRA